jgi:hypothetical protein
MMMHRRLAGPFLLFLTTTSLAADYVQVQERGALKGEVRMSAEHADKDSAVILFRDKVKFTITLQGLPPIALADEKDTVEKVDQALTISNLWGQRDRPTYHYSDDRSRWQLEFTLDPRAADASSRDPKRSDPHVVGGNTLQLPPISFSDGSGSTELRWNPIRVSFTVGLENADNPRGDQVRHSDRLEEPTLSSRRTLWWVLLSIALVVLVVSFAATAVLYFRWRKEDKALTPRDLALREVQQLEEQQTDASRVEEFHTQLSDVVRTYLERQFRLRAPQQTTPEFLAAMQSWPLLPAIQQELLKTFLERCDMVKFAKVVQTPEECRVTAAMAREIVHYTPPVDGPDTSQTRAEAAKGT